MKRAKTVGESATAGWRRGKSKIKIEFAVYPPSQVSTADVSSVGADYDGLFLSNGPGDPTMVREE